MLTLTNLSIDRRLTGVNVTAAPGRLVHIIGPNGAGKSTLLAAAAGLLPHRGDVLLCGENVAKLSARELARRRAYLAQQQDSRAMMRVFQYLELHLPEGAEAEHIESVTAWLAERLELSDKLDRLLTRLSGGEWQRVRLAAVFLQVWPGLNPDGRLLLLDEPMSSLDVAQQDALDRLLRQFCQSGGTAIVSVHHLNHALSHADDVWLLNEGRLIAEGAPSEVMTPERLSSVFGIGFELLEAGKQKWLKTQPLL